jgi:hypothetical protein
MHEVFVNQQARLIVRVENYTELIRKDGKEDFCMIFENHLPSKIVQNMLQISGKVVFLQNLDCIVLQEIY